MVTTNSGSAMPMVAARLKLGMVNTGVASCQGTAAKCNCPRASAKAMPTNSTPGTA